MCSTDVFKMIKMTNLKIALLIVFQTVSVSFADYYSAPLHGAHWKITKGSSSCQLEQEIPLYGVADFMQHSGDVLRFSIRENRHKPEIVKASLMVETSPWTHQSISAKDYLVSLNLPTGSQNYSRLSVYGDAAETMLDALANGQYPTFSYVRADISGLSAETNVAVSSVNFLIKYQQFVDCRKDFLPYGIKQLLERSLFFKSGSKFISYSILAQLNNAARYVKEVKGAQVVIVSNTAVAGGRDKNWFLKRANVIAGKLKGLGVPENKVKIKAGRRPVMADNKTVQLSVFGPDALKAIYYRKGNISLTQTEMQRLDLIVHYADNFLPNSQLLIRSYTDNKGSRANNLKISQKRGDVIKHYLVSKGLDDAKVRIKAYGESKPAKSNRFPTGRAQNRRAIIDFVG
jgi:outer membrane protein OmpA-like peptidoglycan-associated protein